MADANYVFDRVVEARSNDEWCEPVCAARIRLTRPQIERILKLSEIAQEHSLASVREYSYEPDWGFLDDDEAFVSTYDAGDRNINGPFRSEGDQAAVYPSVEDGFVLWMAYWKHTEVKMCTDYVWLSELRAALSGEEVSLSLNDTNTTESPDG
jgi:hypothetical protein